MGTLRKRFGRLLAANRRRRGLTQEALATAARVSTETITKLEIGATGARFPVIERLSQALEIDPAELFTPDIPKSQIRRGAYGELSEMLAQLSEPELLWLQGILSAVLQRPETRAKMKTPHTPPRPAEAHGKRRGQT